MNVKHFIGTGFVAALALAMTPLLHAAAPVTEAPAWYATISGGALVNTSDADSRVQLGKAPTGLMLDGRTRFDGGQSLAVAIGRQWHTDEDDTDEEPRHWRLEAEFWQGRIKRSSFDAGVLHENLNDSVRARVLFGNALRRVRVTEKTRWWLGAGLGYASVKMPNISSLASCGCLNSADGNGLAAQVKLIGERVLSESTALFFQLGYLQVPSADTGTDISGSKTSHDKIRSGNIAVGLRFRF